MVAAGDNVEAADVNSHLNAPLVRVVASGTQSITDNTSTALQFAGAAEIDTHNFHNESSNNTRITPTVAGYYRLSGTYYTSARSDYNLLQAGIRKNGSTNVAPAERVTPPATSFARSVAVEAIVSANGTTDYFELMVTQDNTANVAVLTNQSSQFSSVFECVFLRPL